jgi:hypothetical protein
MTSSSLAVGAKQVAHGSAMSTADAAVARQCKRRRDAAAPWARASPSLVLRGECIEEV